MLSLRKLIAGPGSSVLSSLAAIAVGLLAGLAVLFVSDAGQAPRAFGAILTSGVSNLKEFGQVLYYATPIIMTGLSVGFANKTGLFNIGASGQFIVGAFAAVFVGVKGTFLPAGIHWVAGLLAAAVAGALWGAIPGILKALRNVNEVIACIMMNYIGMYLVNYLITKTVFDQLKNQSKRVADAANIPNLGFDAVFRDGTIISSAGGGIVIALALCVVMWAVLDKTTFGYELKACGLGRDAARYAGIGENRSIILSMVIAGALSGVGGALLYLAGSGKAIDVIDVLAAEGFNGIPVALLGLNNPIGILFSGLFVAYLTVGGFNMQLFGFAREIIEIIIATILYFSAFALLVKGALEQLANRRAALPERGPAKEANPSPGAAPDTGEGDES